MTARPLPLGIALAAALAVELSGTASARYERAPYWTIAPDDYTKTGDSEFPETANLPQGRDIGIAFSGGGTRSATATIGELRGLKEIGLLERVQYVSAVSGGAWAVIPWMFAGDTSDVNMLGSYQAPGDLRFAEAVGAAHGTLAAAVANVSLALAGSKEAALEVWAHNVSPTEQGLLGLVRRALGGARSTDRTYATLLAKTLLEPIKEARDSDFQWNERQGQDYADLNPGPRPRTVVQPRPGRPFMIVSANVVNAGPDFGYPHAVPFEFTPMYVGTRQSVGGLFGGLYTWPTAYNATTARTLTKTSNGGVLEYSHDQVLERLSLPDVAAATGAAPLFWIVGGSGLGLDLREFIRVQGGSYFPQFMHLAARDGDVVQPRVKWPHADGGARDNLGIAALLARHVKKIIVFVNVDSGDFNSNTDIASLFETGQAASASDKSGNVVFKRTGSGRDGLAAIRQAFQEAREQQRPLVTCGVYDVQENRLFNIRAYDGVKVCWVYPDLVEPWKKALDDQVEGVLDGTTTCAACGNLTRFPWFKTFLENRDPRGGRLKTVGLINLTHMQVNLLSNLMAWTTVTARSTLESGLR